MYVGLAALVLVVVAVALVPIVMMTLLFAVVDYFSDEQKLEEIRQARREGRPVDFSGTDTASSANADEPVQVVDPPPHDDADGLDRPARPHVEPESPTRCPNCGEENDSEFDRCWNCQAVL